MNETKESDSGNSPTFVFKSETTEHEAVFLNYQQKMIRCEWITINAATDTQIHAKCTTCYKKQENATMGPLQTTGKGQIEQTKKRQKKRKK